MQNKRPIYLSLGQLFVVDKDIFIGANVPAKPFGFCVGLVLKWLVCFILTLCDRKKGQGFGEAERGQEQALHALKQVFPLWLSAIYLFAGAIALLIDQLLAELLGKSADQPLGYVEGYL